MLFNLFFLTVTITKRKYSNGEVAEAEKFESSERHLNELKSKQFEQQVWSYLGRM